MTASMEHTVAQQRLMHSIVLGRWLFSYLRLNCFSTIRLWSWSSINSKWKFKVAATSECVSCVSVNPLVKSKSLRLGWILTKINILFNFFRFQLDICVIQWSQHDIFISIRMTDVQLMFWFGAPSMSWLVYGRKNLRGDVTRTDCRVGGYQLMRRGLFEPWEDADWQTGHRTENLYLIWHLSHSGKPVWRVDQCRFDPKARQNKWQIIKVPEVFQSKRIDVVHPLANTLECY